MYTLLFVVAVIIGIIAGASIMVWLLKGAISQAVGRGLGW